MGNHFHFIVHFEKFRHLSHEELMDSANKLYGHRADEKTAGWNRRPMEVLQPASL